MSVAAYTVKTDTYEGPFELLMQAIKEGRIDVYDVSLSKITHEYLEYLKNISILNLNNASEFLVMVACLLEMKSKKLLPQSHLEVEIKQEEEIEMDLARHIQEYNIYKHMAKGLRRRKEEFSKIYSRYHFNEKKEKEDVIKLKNVNLEDLVAAFQRVWEQAQKEDEVRAITEETVTLPARIEEVKRLLKESNGRVHFKDLFIRRTRVEIVVTFLAVLELSRQRLINLLQGERFDEIYISLSEN
ncbi:MAG: segregation/condensation protein A [Candidatus Saganbacteria bacterium]|nr:segregation/condensation protein A [Candidatus Saganbacteria bacterium]